MPTERGALAGVRVIDMATLIAAPGAARHLADFGAEVIKVEAPAGDGTRNYGWPHPDDGVALFWKQVGRNKRTVVIDAKTDAGLAALRGLIDRSDVLIENLRPGTLERLGLDNFTSIVDFIDRHRIDCDCERTGIIEVASTWHTPTYADELRDDYEQLAALGHDVVWLDRDAMRDEIHSPVFTAGLWGRDSGALLDPARLAWGLKRVAEQLGVRIHEDTRATGLERDGAGMAVRTPLATIRAHRVALGTNTWRPLVRGASSYVIPVYDYCLTTEPLTPQQLAGLGWRRRQGLSDVSNQFHYYRLTADDRVLWGGYDAIYHYGGRTDRELESRPESWARLARQFFETFPQLEGVRFSHMWGAPIDTCSRFSVFWDTAYSGRVAYAMGYTGLGVASSRFGAEVMLDLLDGVDSPATRTRFVRTKPRRWPPEPVRWLAIQQTRRSLEREDRTGRRNWWLRLLDRIGLGFDT